MAKGLLEGRDELIALFDELDAELSKLGAEAEIVMVGGAWMLWQELRASTRDVDSARRLEAKVRDAVSRIGELHDLSTTWLNDAASAFWPSGADLDDCAVAYEGAALVVRAPTPEVVFVMKLYRSSPQDREDMVAIWPLCDFANAAAARDAFVDAYPHAPDDPHLADHIADIAQDAELGR